MTKTEFLELLAEVARHATDDDVIVRVRNGLGATQVDWTHASYFFQDASKAGYVCCTSKYAAPYARLAVNLTKEFVETAGDVFEELEAQADIQNGQGDEGN